MTRSPTLFESPAVSVVARPTVLALRHVATPDLLCERLVADGRCGVGLLARQGETGATRTLVAARSLLRLELRGSVATVTACEVSAEPLLGPLKERLAAVHLRDVELLGDTLRVLVPEERSALGTPDEDVLRAPSALDVLRATVGLLRDATPGMPSSPGLLGVFGYELVDRWEDLGPRAPDPLDEPDFSFVLVGDVVVYESALDRATAIVRGLPWERARDVLERSEELLARLAAKPHVAPIAPARHPVRAASAASCDPEFAEAVGRLLRHIELGDIFQAVLSRPVELRSDAPPFAVFRALGTDAPWRFLLDLDDGELIGASPETCLSVVDGQVELRPLAGTVPRGLRLDGRIDPDLDRRLGVQLLLDDKEQAEHAMLVDLARNDVARVSVPGTTQLTRAFELMQMPRVQHLASTVQGQLRPGLDALHAYRAVANMGTLTGAPKPMAMRLVRALEPSARGFYGGAVGFLGADGQIESCIAIRTLRRKKGAGVYAARAGAGIVHDSRAENEFAETEHKLAQLRAAVSEVTA